MTLSYFTVLDVNRCIGRKMCCSLHSDKNGKFLLTVGNSEIYRNKSCKPLCKPLCDMTAPREIIFRNRKSIDRPHLVHWQL